ncbi:MAG TPA: ChbG/HpnK family deacetylase [Candidatus Binatia bacterium]|nr:ChbG/HpnK family deacetylase [Candidatus Binatia bacterium]
MKVIFHADDFGLTRAVNEGIVEAQARGILGSTSLIVNAEAAEDAASLAHSNPALDVGLHVTLVEERPVLPPDRIPSLVSGGRFWPTHGAVFARYATRRWKPEEAAAEVAAQWDRLAGLGLQASHCDGHQHLHLLPRVLPTVVALAHAHDVRCIRTRLGGPTSGAGSVVRRILLQGLNAVAATAWRRVPAAERAATVTFATVGFLEAGGGLTRERLLAVLDDLRHRGADVVEVMLHPGERDAETERKYGHWHYRWDSDLALLLDPALPEALSSRGIETTSFRELARHVGRS